MEPINVHGQTWRAGVIGLKATEVYVNLVGGGMKSINDSIGRAIILGSRN